MCIFIWTLFSGLDSRAGQQAAHVSALNVDFDAVFGSQGANNDVKPTAGKTFIKEASREAS